MYNRTTMEEVEDRCLESGWGSLHQRRGGFRNHRFKPVNVGRSHIFALAKVSSSCMVVVVPWVYMSIPYAVVYAYRGAMKIG